VVKRVRSTRAVYRLSTAPRRDRLTRPQATSIVAIVTGIVVVVVVIIRHSDSFSSHQRHVSALTAPTSLRRSVKWPVEGAFILLNSSHSISYQFSTGPISSEPNVSECTAKRPSFLRPIHQDNARTYKTSF